MRHTVVILIFCALAGCAGELPNQARLTDAMTSYNNQDDNECRLQGTTVGTEPYFQCRQALAQEHIDEADAREAERRQAAAANTPTTQPNQRPPQR